MSEQPASSATPVSAPAPLDLTAAAPGTELARAILHFTREDLVRYAGASGDFNPIHYRDDVAAEMGLPGVLAHGMLTMAAALSPLADTLGDPARIRDYQVRFSRPLAVDPRDGADLEVVATLVATPAAEAEAEDAVARVDLTVAAVGEAVLTKAQVRVRA